jgi:hypothetical protein
MGPGCQTRDPDQGIDHLHHCARCLVVLTCLWSPNSSICSLCGQVDLYIGEFGCIPYKWKQICAHWTCGGGSGSRGSLVCCVSSGILLEARRWVFFGGARRHWCPCSSCAMAEAIDLQVSFLTFSCSLHCFGPCLNMRYTRNIVAL